MLYNLYPWHRTENILVLLERMKEVLYFPPNVKVQDWIKVLIKDMLTVDEEKRASMKEVQKRIETYCGAIEAE